MSKRKTEQAMGAKKKNKSNLEQLSGQLDKDGLILRDVANGASRPTRMVAPAGVERFSDDEDDMMPMLNAAFKKANKTMTALVKVTGENAKRKSKVAQMPKAAVSDSEEDEGAVDQMEVTARQQASALQAEEGDPEPVVLQQVLFHIQVAGPSDCKLGAVEDMIQGCSARLQDLSAVAAGSVDLLSTLLLNGWLVRYCFSSGKRCSAGLVQSLFRLLAHSSSLKVATAAYKTLLALLGDTQQYQALTGSLTSLPTVSPLYSTPAQPPRLEAVPTEKDFIAALQGLGVNPQQAGQVEEAQPPGLSDSQEQQPAKGTMYHLQLVLRTLAAVYRCNSKDTAAGLQASTGRQQLLLVLLALRMDPVGQLLVIEIQGALDALLSVYTAQEWQKSLSSLSKQVPGVGPSHRAHLVALKYLPAHNPRGFALQQAATAYMLQGLCRTPTKVQQGNRQYNADEPVAPEEAIQACSWFQAGGAAMAKACQGKQGVALFSLWEAETCIKAADLLLWPHIKQAKQTGEGGLTSAFKLEWQEFIQALSRGLSNSHKVAAHSLKLHIAVMQAWDK